LDVVVLKNALFGYKAFFGVLEKYHSLVKYFGFRVPWSV
jgi:hypothetical protein